MRAEKLQGGLGEEKAKNCWQIRGDVGRVQHLGQRLGMQHISVLISSKVWEVEAKPGELIFNPTLDKTKKQMKSRADKDDGKDKDKDKDKDDGKDDCADVEQQFAAREGRKCIRAQNVLF